MKTLLNKLLKTRRRPRRHPPKPTAGYTMIELLVGMVIAALIITPMLGFVVNVLNSDVREQAKTNSEQELQAAIDYIAQDMSQAVYVYDLDKDSWGSGEEQEVNDFIAQLPHSTDTNKTPILVFWKREFVDNALAFDGGICESPDTDRCDDTFVLSLVAYYQIAETDTSSIWCEPSGNPCPKRIARFQIQDGVKDLSGNYVCGSDGRGETECGASAKKKFMRDWGFDDYNSDPIAWEKKSGEDYTDPKANDAIVLVNYVENLELVNPIVDTDTEDGNRPISLIEKSNYKFAKIEVVGNALRRSQSDFSCEVTPATTPATYKNDPYCPKATAQVGARSGFGE